MVEVCDVLHVFLLPYLQVVSVPIIANLNPRLPQLPQAIPRDLADTLLAFHGHPFVWFADQFLKYLNTKHTPVSYTHLTLPTIYSV